MYIPSSFAGLYRRQTKDERIAGKLGCRGKTATTTQPCRKLTMFQQDGRDLRMAVQNADEFRSAIAAMADDSGEVGHLVNYSSP